MNRSYIISQQPATEPVTLDEVKLYTRVPHDIEDATINGFIKAGRILAENYQHRAYITQTWKLTYDSFPPSQFCFPRPPLVSITSFEYTNSDGDTETLSSSDYQIDDLNEPGRFSLNYNTLYPSGITLRPLNGVVITFVAGYGAAADVPQDVKDAIYIYCAWRYENRTAEEEIPNAVKDILRPNRFEAVR